ncbi:MAG TPA: hypothetical protein EYG11_02420 [Candidatus Latescibacteria bacterium]|nr:hypothetical protein [Candidatus Handelsmanbacteria bacterium]HIL07533.1 hypothetical protein [Candidatus Latescibacterota bacterium]
MGEDSVSAGKRQVLCQAAILFVVLVVRWPFPEQDPKDARSHYGLGVCRLHLQQYEAGVEALERVRVLASAAVETLVNLGSAYGQLRQIDRQ